MKKIGIVMGSKSDLPVVQKAIDTLRELDIPFEAHIYSAHRTPAEAADFARNARDQGIVCFWWDCGHFALFDRHREKVLHPEIVASLCQ